MITKDVAEAMKITEKALGRMKGGVKKYGVFDPDTDRRDLLEWAEEELLDHIIYSSMLIMRLRHLGEKLRKAGLY